MANINMLQWNGRSVLANKGTLERYLFDKNISICFLSETWFKRKMNIHFSGYNIYREDRHDGYGGVALLLKSSLAVSPTPLYHKINNVMTISIAVRLPSGKTINLYSIYVKPGLSIAQNDWKNFFGSLKKPFLVGGDFNCHNVAWGCSTTDRLGKNLLEAIDECNLIYLNNGKETILSRPGSINKSAIDITISTADVAHLFDWTWMIRH
uniref:Uncharacterized protein LOC114348514 n=1 Tax=Diabrotica virgifera virgifera TaxID=50390 RepID=A0A6P7HGS4_DIAVI